MFQSNTKNAANATMDSAKDTFHSAKHDLQDGVGAGRDEFLKLADTAGHSTRHFIDTTTAQINDLKTKISNEVHDNPMRSTLFAAGFGLMLGMLLRR